MELLEIKAVLVNLKGYKAWEYNAYRLKESEAKIIIEALEECLSRRSGNNIMQMEEIKIDV